jgi:hypothetical protein
MLKSLSATGLITTQKYLSDHSLIAMLKSFPSSYSSNLKSLPSGILIAALTFLLCIHLITSYAPSNHVITALKSLLSSHPFLLLANNIVHQHKT